MIRSVYSALVWLVLLPVHAYRVALSPLKRGPSCRFLPTCSEYAIEAVKQRGIFVGIGLAAWRILRCNPLCRAGYDPVPPRRCLRCDPAGISSGQGIAGPLPRDRSVALGQERC
jgi:putative membrane protein insertion efficiency factor